MRNFSTLLSICFVIGLSGCASSPTPRQTLVLATGASGGAFADYGPGIGKVVAAHSRFESVPLGLINMGLACRLARLSRPPIGHRSQCLV